MTFLTSCSSLPCGGSPGPPACPALHSHHMDISGETRRTDIGSANQSRGFAGDILHRTESRQGQSVSLLQLTGCWFLAASCGPVVSVVGVGAGVLLLSVTTTNSQTAGLDITLGLLSRFTSGFLICLFLCDCLETDSSLLLLSIVFPVWVGPSLVISRWWRAERWGDLSCTGDVALSPASCAVLADRGGVCHHKPGDGVGGRGAGGSPDWGETAVTSHCTLAGPAQDNEVREFTGWIKGRPEDYIMDLQRAQHRSKAQSNTKNTQTSLNLFSPGIKNDYESLLRKQNEIANLTYKKGKSRVQIEID